MNANIRFRVLAAGLCIVTAAAAQDVKPCDSTVRFVDHNMIDYSVKVAAIRGSVVEFDGVAVYKACVALFANDRSTLLQIIEAEENGAFEIKGVKPGDYWLVVQDGQRVFCPAAAHIKLRRFARKTRLAVRLEVGRADRCSYCEAK